MATIVARPRGWLLDEHHLEVDGAPLAGVLMDFGLYFLHNATRQLTKGSGPYFLIKTFRERAEFVLPDRNSVAMTVPFMRAYTELLVKTCHRRGAFAIGGMAAFIPSRRDPEVNAAALEKVRQDNEREASDGFDGSWVAHPDLVRVAREIFEQVALAGEFVEFFTLPAYELLDRGPTTP